MFQILRGNAEQPSSFRGTNQTAVARALSGEAQFQIPTQTLRQHHVDDVTSDRVYHESNLVRYLKAS